MAEKQCKHCCETINSEASICPHCRKKQPEKLKWYHIGLIVIIFISFFRACSVDSPPISSSPQAQLEEALTVKGKKIKAKHPDWKNEICNLVADQRIRIGMTREQVRSAWGKPYKINYTNTKYGTSEQWVMHEYGSTYVYFDNGIMTSSQTSN